MNHLLISKNQTNRLTFADRFLLIAIGILIIAIGCFAIMRVISPNDVCKLAIALLMSAVAYNLTAGGK